MPTDPVADPLDELAKEAARGGRAAFSRFAQVAGPLIFRLAMRVTAHPDDADDCTQETLVRAFIAFSEGRYHARGSARAWLRTIVVRVALDERRARGRRRAREAAWPAAVRVAPAGPHAVALEEVMAQLTALPASQRVALVLREVEGMSQREIAAAMKCSEGAVEQRLVRARAELRKGWVDDG